MALTGTVPAHPAQYSPEILAVLADLIDPDEHVHDPFAGLGLRLGALCDSVGATFSGTDIEDWPTKRDARVRVGDSLDPSTYPDGRFTVVTSPVYHGNRISSDYVSGPTPTTKLNGRRAYGISLGRPLHPNNLARLCRPRDLDKYLARHGHSMRWWSRRALVNVDGPMADAFVEILEGNGYRIVGTHRIGTRRYKVGGSDDGYGADKRATHEVVIEAEDQLHDKAARP